MKHVTQISFLDVSTAHFENIDTWDSIDIDKFPIPHKGDIVNLMKHDDITDIDTLNVCQDYKVTDVKYIYKRINKMIFIYITVYVKKI